MNLYDILACPTCKTAVIRQEQTLTCVQCRRTYPIVDNIPILLPEGTTPAPYDHAILVRTSYDLGWLPRVVLQSLPADAIHLEIGAGNLALSVPNIIRMDITQNPYVDVIGDAHALPFLPGTFSFIFSSAVIEHLRQPFIAAQEMYNVLRNGGYVYGECSFIFPYHGHPHHYFNASHRGMEQVFESFTSIRAGVGAHQMPSFAIEALLLTYLRFVESHTDPGMQLLKDLLRQVLAQPLRHYDARFSQDAALFCAACTYFFGVKSPQASAVIPAVLQSLYAQRPELQQRFPNLFDLGIAENILAWAPTADRQHYPMLAEYFETLVPFYKNGVVENGHLPPLHQEPSLPSVAPPLPTPSTQAVSAPLTTLMFQPPLLTRALQVAREQGFRAVGDKAQVYLRRKLQEREVALRVKADAAKRLLRSLQPLPPKAAEPAAEPPMNGDSSTQKQFCILDHYVTSAPHPQHALDIFQGEWMCALPEPFSTLRAGIVPAFDDARVEWGIKQLGGVQGKTVLELGPMEGEHTYMLERHGAAEIVAIEANTRAYLKCLITKEVLALKHARFLCGDFTEYLPINAVKFDVCFASGVLYHMRNPVELLTLIGKATDRVYLWTHYYDQQIISRNLNLAGRFAQGVMTEDAGFPHTLHRYSYGTAVSLPYFCGGSAAFSHWLSRADLLACLQHVGLSNIEINFEEPDHPHGPCFALVATRR